MIKVSKKLEWIRPYVELGIEFISKKHKLDRVGCWSLGKSRGIGEHAAIFQNKLKDGHRIWMHTHYNNGNGPQPFSKIDLLTHLAHELAHMEDWKHTPKHKKLETKILSAFMSKLIKDGYVSEEKELNEKLP